MLDLMRQPWPWYVAGPLIGLLVPLLLLVGNKSLGLSSNLRHICAACFPGKIPFFQYDWRKEAWNLYFAGGIALGALFASLFLADPEEVRLAEATVADLQELGIRDFTFLLPADIFRWEHLLSLRGAVILVGGGFLLGFGTRYAGGCTSGHGIMGIASLQWPSLVATICFMVGGYLCTHLLLPFILSL
ncbi:YeeE/YedE family protein [soil metagenome]